MKITCPNCQKRYKINDTVITAKAKAAKCKACGYIISLKSSSFGEQAGESHVLNISCRYCGRTYALCQNKIPPGAGALKCRSCGHLVPFKQKKTSTPVRPLKKESSQPASAQPATEPVGLDSRQEGYLRITCKNCLKKFKIRQNIIPPNAIAVTCKACGHDISLPHATVTKTLAHLTKIDGSKNITTPAKKRIQEQPLASEGQPEKEPPPPQRSRKKSWLLAAAAGVLLMVILGLFAGSRFMNVGRQNQIIPEQAKKKIQTSDLLKEETPFAGNKEIHPTKGPVETQYSVDPQLFTTVDVDALKPKIPQIIQQSLFPDDYWNFGDKPHMTLELDTVDIPNAALAELTYNVLSIQSPDGKDILRVEEKESQPKIHPGNVFPGRLSLGVKNATPPDALGAARIHFDLSLPVALQIFQWNAGDKKGSVKTTGGVRITLEQLEKDIAQISYTGGKSVYLIAYDPTGKALASRESVRSSISASARFQGIIDTLKVVVAEKILEYPFNVEVDLNQGKEWVLSRKPEIPPRIRYDHNPAPEYVEFTNQDLDKLAVAWNETDESELANKLFLRLPKGPFSGHAQWEVHFFGQNKPQFLTGNAVQGTQNVAYRMDKDKLKNVDATFGKVQLNIQTDIRRLCFDAKDNNHPEPRILPSGDQVSVSFDKNEVSYSAGKAMVIRTSGYDALGKRLKQDNFIRSKGDQRQIYFWGRPAEFEIELAAKTITKQILFDIKRRPLDENTYRAFQQTIENQRAIVSTLKSIEHARRRDLSCYGDDLAGLYYLYDRKKKKPMELIDKAIALSDPAGQKRFRYDVKPFKGYYFSVLSGTQTAGANQDYKRQSKKIKFIWDRGTVITSALLRHPDLVATPKDKSQPTFLLQWGRVYMKRLYGMKLNYLPENPINKGWVETKFIEG